VAAVLVFFGRAVEVPAWPMLAHAGRRTAAARGGGGGYVKASCNFYWAKP
jgi:hypothetical protein